MSNQVSHQDFLAIDKEIAEQASPPSAGPQDKAQEQQKTARLVPVSIAEIKSRELPVDAVEDLLPETGLAALAGDSGHAKSGLALDLAFHFVLGRSWFGRKVQKRPVSFFFLEAASGLNQRIRAWEKVNEIEIDDRLDIQFFDQAINLLSDSKLVADSVQDDAVIIIDTLRAAAPAIDENSSKDMGLVLQAMKEIRALKPMSLVLFTHHVPKSGGRSSKDRNKLAGWSGLPANIDAVLITDRDGDNRAFYNAKIRDSVDGVGFAYRLQVVSVGTNRVGKAVTSYAIVPDGKPKKKVSLSPRPASVLKAFDHACEIHKTNIVSQKQLREIFYDQADPDDNPNTVKQSLKEGKKTLIELGILRESETNRHFYEKVVKDER